MTDDYAPTIERIEDMYSWAYAWRTADDLDDGETDLAEMRESQRAEFRRSLVAHDAEIVANERAKTVALLRARHTEFFNRYVEFGIPADKTMGATCEALAHSIESNAHHTESASTTLTNGGGAR